MMSATQKYINIITGPKKIQYNWEYENVAYAILSRGFDQDVQPNVRLRGRLSNVACACAAVVIQSSKN